jgi:hypothetical protein
MTAQQACSGFKNLVDCVFVIHVSHNLGIPFEDLKGKMTGSSSENLGRSIHDLDPNVDAKKEKRSPVNKQKADIEATTAS